MMDQFRLPLVVYLISTTRVSQSLLACYYYYYSCYYYYYNTLMSV